MSFLKNLTKPICFFDLETTGISIVNDRIVEISVLKIEKNDIKIPQFVYFHNIWAKRTPFGKAPFYDL